MWGLSISLIRRNPVGLLRNRFGSITWVGHRKQIDSESLQGLDRKQIT